MLQLPLYYYIRPITTYLSLLLKKLLLSILKKITTHNYTTKFLPVVVQNLARICLSIIALWLPPSHIIKMHSSSLKQQQQRHLSTINNIPYMSLKISIHPLHPIIPCLFSTSTQYPIRMTSQLFIVRLRTSKTKNSKRCTTVCLLHTYYYM